MAAVALGFQPETLVPQPLRAIMPPYCRMTSSCHMYDSLLTWRKGMGDAVNRTDSVPVLRELTFFLMEKTA